MGSEIPKQFLPCCGKEIFRHSLDTFLATTKEGSGGVLLVLSPDRKASFAEDFPVYESVLRPKRLVLVSGGSSRAESVAHGLEQLDELIPHDDNPLVAVHDAARPLLDRETLLDLKQKALKLEPNSLLLAGHWSRDTVLRVPGSSHELVETLPREQIFLAETPQVFFRKGYFAARRLVGEAWRELTDESSLFLRAGYAVRPWPLARWNFKLTYDRDLDLLEALLGGPSR